MNDINRNSETDRLLPALKPTDDPASGADCVRDVLLGQTKDAPTSS